jgi:hypothetical protein
MDLVLTLIFFFVAGTSFHVGTLRPVASIPTKIIELTAVGLSVGIVASIANRALDLSMVTLGIAFTVLIDLDHLPSVFGFEQPIRPAHSLAFLSLTIIVLSLTIRNQPWVELIMISSFLAHMASDTGVFAFLAPFSFQYFSLDAFKIPFAAGSIAFAIAAGYLKFRYRSQGSSNIIEVKGVITRT